MPALRGLLFLALGALATAVPAAAPGGAALPEPVGAVLGRERLPESSLSLVVQDVRAPRPLVSVNADVPRNPASTMKLVTTLAALHVLGPDFTWKTDVSVDPGREVDPDGRLAGNLYLHGRGDPFLVTEQLWRLLREVRSRGIGRIEGDLVIDDTYFELEAHDPGAFDGKPERAYNVGPDAALLNFGTTDIHIEARTGLPRPAIALEPPLAGAMLENELSLARGGCGASTRLFLDVLDPAVPAIRLRGTFPEGCGRRTLLRVIASREAYARGVLTQLWEEVGGELAGRVRFGPAPPGARRVARLESEPLARLIWSVNKFSNNVMSRQLLLTLGAEVQGPPGTVAKGQAVIMRWLARRGIPTEGLVIDNGSGLSRTGRMSARTLAALLLDAYHDPWMAEFVSTLPLAAIDGSMRKRHREGPLAGRAHLKTGLLDDVRAIAGYVHAPGRDYLVVAIQNHPGVHQGAGTRVQDALLGWVHSLGGATQAMGR